MTLATGFGFVYLILADSAETVQDFAAETEFAALAAQATVILNWVVRWVAQPTVSVALL